MIRKMSGVSLVLGPDRTETAAGLPGLRFAWASKHARKFSVISSLGVAFQYL